ncbi:MAG: peptidoglycan editing factor PgeF [Sulfurovum sp.]|nr:peptidoglycan editing factor PgeF [Sulfurovum sp.]
MKFELLDGCPYTKYHVTQKDMGSACDFSMALHTGEDSKQVMQNRGKLAEHFGEEYRFCGTRQVHGDKVFVLNSHHEMGWRDLTDAVEADAIVTNLPHMALTILTADCVPILLYDPIAKAIGAVHAGWKGSKSNITRKTIKTMQNQYGSRPQDIIAAIGPAIGVCCYEVGLDVAEYFVDHSEIVQPSKRKGKFQLDLKAINGMQLLDAGLMRSNIEISDICTACYSDIYFSYRKDSCSGRFISAIAIKG